jgi:catechol 2,3-dioxygenase-like lactoylglutathione lyase family enzyme
MTGVAKFSAVALDCPDPQALAEFYSALTGLPITDRKEDWWELAADGGPALAFQLAPDHVPPTWPTGGHPQQIHLDFDVADLDEGERAVLALGARRHEHQPGTTFRVFLDPAGHPFCLCQA